jgi:hypothetical protein
VTTLPINFSTLRYFARSPAHYRAALDRPIKPTRAMRIGTIVHYLVLGARAGRALHVVPGESRRGKAWEAFEAERRCEPHECDIVTQGEHDDAEPVAAAVLADPIAQRLLLAPHVRREVPLGWRDPTLGGLECATSGVDAIGVIDGGYVAELKTTTDTQPDRLMRHSIERWYHAQLAWYWQGCDANAIPVRAAYVVAVEVAPPYAVTVIRMTDPVLEHGRKSLRLWLEKLRQCLDAGDVGEWPAYSQSVVDWVLPAWLGNGDGEAD